ncbi:MAG TPA: pyridoxal-phosphate dependent enzyme [Spirochaetia bacterium]|nr:pyridoxal-phosphate dependent enzyme [Spirochaetia bacterium]
MKWFYRCAVCGNTYDIEPGRYLCDRCSAAQKPLRPLEGILETEWDGEFASDGIPLPVEPIWFPPIPVGNTPLWEPARLRSALGFPRLYLKDDTCNPTGSYKDRASYLVAAFAARHGVKEIALASTGNAASSMAGVGAAAGIAVTVFLPSSAPPAKRIQVLQYGAQLRQVDGTYDVAFDRSLEYTARGGALSRNTAYNPLTIEGKKTVAYEIAAQLASHDGVAVAPDHLFVPVGDGVILAGVYRGFENLVRLGRLDRVPTVWACQADGSNAIARALAAGEFTDPVASTTIADSISVDVPRNGTHALAKLQKYGGRAISVSDREILEAQRRLSAASGLFAEPSSSAAFAGFLKVRDSIDRESRVVLLITGSGLKDTANAARALELA